jgi:hypothetical protein
MLVRKSKYSEGDVVTLKMVNGDEILARFVKEDDNGVVIKTPSTVVPSQNGIAMLKSLFTAEATQEIHIDFSHIMFHAKTIEEIANGYIEKTTGIAPITRGSIIV